MAYELDIREPPDAELRRIAREQFARAIRELGGSDAARGVHEARKAIKRLRSLLRLVRGRLGTVYGQENARLRDVARGLSKMRDARVMCETATVVSAHVGADGPELKPLQEWLEERFALQVCDASGNGGIAAAIEALDSGAGEVADWPLKRLDRASVVRGLARTYRDGRRSFFRARAIGSGEAFHDWRRHVQRHWHHMRLARQVWPDEMTAREATARRLADILGRDHDFVTLAAAIGAGAGGCGLERTAVLDVIRGRQVALRAEATALGRRLYAERARALSRRIDAYWRACASEMRG